MLTDSKKRPFLALKRAKDASTSELLKALTRPAQYEEAVISLMTARALSKAALGVNIGQFDRSGVRREVEIDFLQLL
jgi:hypothetical protein